MRLRHLLLAAAAAIAAVAFWWRKNPSACPYGQRFWVEAPHPFITRARLREVLDPRPGEQALELGPGTGYYTLDVAEWVSPGGSVEILDVQQEMLDHTMARATERGVANITPTLADATKMPYEDASFDAALLVTVLGEVPDQDAALRELARVLKSGGRLVVGELLGDPHYVPHRALRLRAAGAGLAYERRSGSALGYFARFAKPGPEAPAA
ncbi:MAG: class I SAM-dependent methyltransferase [Solirubrobacterales bacterium]